MAYSAQGVRSFDTPHHRPSATGNPFNHCRRSWTDGGMHFTVETATYTSPGQSFRTSSGGANGLFDAFFGQPEPATRRQGGGLGLLGTALNLLGAASEVRQATQAHRSQPRGARRRVQIEELEDANEEVDLAYGESESAYNANPRPRSMFSRFKEKLSDNRRGSKNAPHRGDASPVQQPQTSQHGSYRAEARQPQRKEPYVDDDSDSTEYEPRREQHDRPQANRTRSSHSDTSAALENAVTYYQAQVERCRRRLERASRQATIDTVRLQALLNELKMHERSLTAATESLQAEKNRQTGAGSRRSAPHNTRPAPRRQPSATVEDDLDDLLSGTRFATSSSQPRAAHAFFADFGNHHTDPFSRSPFATFHTDFFSSFGGASIFDDDFHRFFSTPGGAFPGAQRKRPRFSTANSGPQTEPTPGFATFMPPSPAKAPSTLMKPGEAKALFKTYSDRWLAVPQNDPNIPYPCRGLQAQALQARNTLWAPNISAHPATWSEETVMKANAQLFFLNVVDLEPQYAEALGTGRVEMGYNKLRARPEQVQQLVEMLKKERNRWHSDRLGRRNGGIGGTNELLQNDERARAVFHAVCELLESAQ